MRQLSVLVSGKYALSRQTIASALAAQNDIVVVAVCGDLRDTLLQVERLAPVIVLVEANFHGHEYRKICETIKDQGLSTRVLVAGEIADEQVLMAAVEAGADGYVSGDLGLSGLAGALRRIAAGEAVVPPMMLGRLLGALVERRQKRNVIAQRLSELSPRENQVLALMTEGADRYRIADRLVISPETARTHIQNVISKLGARSRVGAIALTVEHGLLDEVGAEPHKGTGSRANASLRSVLRHESSS